MNNYQTDIEKAGLKKRLFNLGKEMIEQRIAAANTAIVNAQAAANAEEKSSAGDKYETSRAMNHLEKDMYSRQLAANRNELAALFSIDYTSLYDSVTAGSFVRFDDCSFFIVAGIGKIYFEGEDIYLISPNSPMAKLLINRKPGSMITFNKRELIIRVVF